MLQSMVLLAGCIHPTWSCVQQTKRVLGSSDGQHCSFEDSKTYTPVIRQFLQRARQAEGKKYFRAAKNIYEQVLVIAPEHREALVCLACLWNTVNRPQDATATAKRAVDADPKDAATMELYADCLSACGRHKEALQAYEWAVDLAKAGRLPCAKVDCRQCVREDRVHVSMARALYAMGGSYQDAASAIVMNILSGNAAHPQALALYAQIAAGQGMLHDAIRVLLRLLVQQPDSRAVLEAEMGGAEAGDMDAALAFLASVIKDHGAVEASNSMLRESVAAKPANVGYALQLVHGIQLELDYRAALEVVASLLSHCWASPTSLGHSRQPDAMCTRLQLPGASAGLFRLIEQQLRQIIDGSSSHLTWPELEPWEPALHSATWGTTPNDQAFAQYAPQTAHQTVEYSPAQLDFLALLFTAVKVLYTGGALPACCRLVRVLEPLRQASHQPLHHTLIRNETAYFGCIQQLLTEAPPPALPLEGTSRPLFLCGDSHCLAGNFFPHHAFQQTMESLPDGSQVIFLFGEIDCREGLTMAVDKLKYETLEAAMEVLLQIYQDVLLDLMASRRFEVFVHCVAPVLDATRHVVVLFNQLLKKRMQKLSLQLNRLHWLDFSDRLLAANGKDFNPSLNFDGTHMSPRYVSYMNAAFETIS
eukprot:jgi/Astpho2/5922/fgenesh1_pg.00080_%23_120_t